MIALVSVELEKAYTTVLLLRASRTALYNTSLTCAAAAPHTWPSTARMVAWCNGPRPLALRLRGCLEYRERGKTQDRFCQGVVVLDKGLAVGRVLVEFDQLDVVHRVRLLDVGGKVELVQLLPYRVCKSKVSECSGASRRLSEICARAGAAHA